MCKRQMNRAPNNRKHRITRILINPQGAQLFALINNKARNNG